MFHKSVNYLSIHAERFSVHLGMITVVLIGTGNMARQLCLAWQNNSVARVVQVIGRNPGGSSKFEGHPVASIQALIPDADFYIIAVSDSSISAVSQHIKKVDGLIVHTSGSISIDVLAKHERTGVLYPLQTMSSGRKVDFSQVPVFLETKKAEDKGILQRLAESLKASSHWIHSNERRQLHLSAVYLNNFTNHLIYLSGERCKAIGMDPEILYPLLEETVAKAIAIGPFEAQTGPARRGDHTVIDEHLSMIEDATQQEIYRIFSQSIQTTYTDELQKLA